jgi:hypothetical protein
MKLSIAIVYKNTTEPEEKSITMEKGAKSSA